MHRVLPNETTISRTFDEAQRCNIRTGAERCNARLKDEIGALRNVRCRGAPPR